MSSTRRTFLHETAAAVLTSAITAPLRAQPAPAPASAALGALSVEALAGLERQVAGRLGVTLIDAAGADRAQYRADERFPLCSTFKVLAVAAVLARVDRGQERLDRSVPFGALDLQEHAPVARARASAGQLSVAELCEAAITVSDNTAANLLLESLGGPARLTPFARSLGDATTRLDRNEPSLNECLPGDERDTTSPRAMAHTLRSLLLGPALSKASRERLAAWMIASTTGRERLRAGLPSTWRAGDKTGTGHRGTSNDIAVLWPPQGKPLVIAAYLTQSSASAEARDGVFAELARRVAALG